MIKYVENKAEPTVLKPKNANSLPHTIQNQLLIYNLYNKSILQTLKAILCIYNNAQLYKYKTFKILTYLNCTKLACLPQIFLVN